MIGHEIASSIAETAKIPPLDWTRKKHDRDEVRIDKMRAVVVKGPSIGIAVARKTAKTGPITAKYLLFVLTTSKLDDHRMIHRAPTKERPSETHDHTGEARPDLTSDETKNDAKSIEKQYARVHFFCHMAMPRIIPGSMILIKLKYSTLKFSSGIYPMEIVFPTESATPKTIDAIRIPLFLLAIPMAIIRIEIRIYMKKPFFRPSMRPSWSSTIDVKARIPATMRAIVFLSMQSILAGLLSFSIQTFKWKRNLLFCCSYKEEN